MNLFRGKIGRLPAGLGEPLPQRLETGESGEPRLDGAARGGWRFSGRRLLGSAVPPSRDRRVHKRPRVRPTHNLGRHGLPAWRNALPAMPASRARDFAGHPIRRQNLSHGYRVGGSTLAATTGTAPAHPPTGPRRPGRWRGLEPSWVRPAHRGTPAGHRVGPPPEPAQPARNQAKCPRNQVKFPRNQVKPAATSISFQPRVWRSRNDVRPCGWPRCIGPSPGGFHRKPRRTCFLRRRGRRGRTETGIF